MHSGVPLEGQTYKGRSQAATCASSIERRQPCISLTPYVKRAVLASSDSLSVTGVDKYAPMMLPLFGFLDGNCARSGARCKCSRDVRIDNRLNKKTCRVTTRLLSSHVGMDRRQGVHGPSSFMRAFRKCGMERTAGKGWANRTSRHYTPSPCFTWLRPLT